MPPVGFEPTVSAGERPTTYALDRAATGTGSVNIVDDAIIQVVKIAVFVYFHEETENTTLNSAK